MTTPAPENLQDHVRFVRALAAGLTRDGSSADDIAQDTWVSALSKPPRHASNLRGFFATIARRIDLREKRSGGRRAAREEAAARPERQSATVDIVARQEILRRVTDAVLALEEPYLSTVIEHYYEDLSVREIVERGGAPEGTVRSRLRRGLEMLRERLDRDHEGDRSAWCSALVALAAPDRLLETTAATSAAVSVTTTGVWAMGMAGKVALAAAGIGLVGWTLWKGTRESVEWQPLAPSEAVVEEARSSHEAAATSSPDALALDRRPVVEPTVAPGATRGSIEVSLKSVRTGAALSDVPIEILCWSHPVGERLTRSRTDSAGLALFEGLRPGDVVVTAGTGASGSVELQAGETARCELEQPPGFAVRGRVVTPDGEGVGGARLWLSEYFNYSEGYFLQATQPDGSFELVDVQEARYLGATAAGYGPSHLHFLSDYQPAEESNDIELTLVLGREGGPLSINVVDVEGAPIPRAHLNVKGADPGTIAGPGGGMLSSIPTWRVWTDERGQAKVQGVPTGYATIVAYAPNKARSVSAIDVRTTGARITLTLKPECIVTGTVRKGREPVAGVSLRVDERYDPMLPSAQSDEEGYFELRGLSAGQVKLMAGSRGVGQAKTSLTLEEGGAATWYPELSEGRVLQGRVVDEEGEPLAGWWVQANIGVYSPWRGQARTDADGRYELLNCKQQPLNLELYRDVLTERVPSIARQVSAQETTVDFVVAAADRCESGLRARFVDERGEAAWTHVALWTARAQSAPGWETDGEGQLDVTQLRPGRYRIDASPRGRPGFSLGWHDVPVAGTLDLGTVELPPLGSVRLAAARTVSWSQFGVLADDGEGFPSWCESIDPDLIGESVELHPGRYVLRATGDGLATEFVPFEVATGRETVVEVRSRPGRSVAIEVRIRAEELLPNRVNLVLSELGGRVLQDQWNGTFRDRVTSFWMSLAEGDYVIDVETPDGRKSSRVVRIELDGEQHGAIEIEL